MRNMRASFRRRYSGYCRHMSFRPHVLLLMVHTQNSHLKGPHDPSLLQQCPLKPRGFNRNLFIKRPLVIVEGHGETLNGWNRKSAVKESQLDIGSTTGVKSIPCSSRGVGIAATPSVALIRYNFWPLNATLYNT